MKEKYKFVKIVTSNLDRAIQTAIAMGYAVDSTDPYLSTFGEEVDVELPWNSGFVNIKNVIDEAGPLARYTKGQIEYFKKMLKNIDHGQEILVISHGGVVDFGMVAMLPNEDHSNWGPPISYCEGYRIGYEQGQFNLVEILRTTQEH